MSHTKASSVRIKPGKPLGKTKGRAMYGDSEKNADMLYATGVFVPDPFFFLQLRGKKYILVNAMEYSRIKEEAGVDHVFSYDEIMNVPDKNRNKRQRNIADICQALLIKKKIHKIEVPRTFPLGLADDLRERGFLVHSVPDPFFRARSVKSAREAALIRKAQQAAEYGMKAAVEALKEARIQAKNNDLILGGERLTSEKMRGLIHRSILEKKSTAMHTIVACGRQGYDPHKKGKGPLKSGQPIIIDIFPRSDVSGYYGDMTRTFVKGKASERVRKMHRAVRAAQNFALSELRPGIDSRKIHVGVTRLFQSRGFPLKKENGIMTGFIHGTGHGVGLDLHEYPSIGQQACRLASGNVVTVEPGLYYPDVGGVRIEDVVWIGPVAVKNLTRFPKYLEIP